MTGIFTALADNTFGGGRADRSRGRKVLAQLDAALGPASGAVTPDARQALLAQARGGEQQLRMLLATVSFLAETEHVPRIDLALVQRAASLQPPPDTKFPARRWHNSGAVLATIVGAVGITLILVFGSTTHRAPNHSSEAVAPKPQSTVVSMPPIKAPAAVAPAVQSVAAPPTVASAAPAWQPADPPPVLHLRFYMADPNSPPRARFIAQRLDRAGFVVDATPDFTDWPPRAAVVYYFYGQDRGVATRVATAADLSPAQVRLVRNSNRWAVPVPGTIELHLP